LAVVDDPALASTVATDFNSMREVVPNLIAPYRIPEACLSWASKNTTLYFIDDPDYVGPGDNGSNADSRQCIQATLTGIDSGIITDVNPPPDTTSVQTLGYFTISGTVEFFEPIPPTSVPSTLKERSAVESLLRALRGSEAVLKRPARDGSDAVPDDVLALYRSAAPCQFDSTGRPVGVSPPPQGGAFPGYTSATRGLAAYAAASGCSTRPSSNKQ
jgi:hypothetical protein